MAEGVDAGGVLVGASHAFRLIRVLGQQAAGGHALRVVARGERDEAAAAQQVRDGAARAGGIVAPGLDEDGGDPRQSPE